MQRGNLRHILDRKYLNDSKMWGQLSVNAMQSMSLFFRTPFQTAKTDLFHYTAMISTFMLAVDSAHTGYPGVTAVRHFIPPQTGSLAPACVLIRARQHTHTHTLAAVVWSKI